MKIRTGRKSRKSPADWTLARLHYAASLNASFRALFWLLFVEGFWFETSAGSIEVYWFTDSRLKLIETNRQSRSRWVLTCYGEFTAIIYIKFYFFFFFKSSLVSVSRSKPLTTNVFGLTTTKTYHYFGFHVVYVHIQQLQSNMMMSYVERWFTSSLQITKRGSFYAFNLKDSCRETERGRKTCSKGPLMESNGIWDACSTHTPWTVHWCRWRQQRLEPWYFFI